MAPPTDSARHGRSGPLFWTTRRGGRVALAGLHVVAAAVIAVELVHPTGAAGHGTDRVDWLAFTGSYGVYGFVGCVALVLLGRLLRRLVMRRENYYRRNDAH